MSDAKAKAEARRAKILARANRTNSVSAIGDIPDSLPVENAPRERPLAARRSRIKSVSERVEADNPDPDIPISPSGGEKASTVLKADTTTTNTGDPTDDPNVESIEEFSATKSHDDTGANAAVDSTEGGSKSKTQQKKVKDAAHADKESDIGAGVEASSNEEKEERRKEIDAKLPPKKTMKEVEQEIAENTAKFDASALAKDKEKQKKAAQEALERKKRHLAAQQNTIQPHSVQRLVRFFIIVALACYQGYFVFQHNRQLPSMGLSPLGPVAIGSSSAYIGDLSQGNADAGVFDEFNAEHAAGSTEGNRASIEGLAEQGSGWAGWIYKKAKNYFECTITAVSFSYYIGNILAAPITSKMKSKPAPTGILERIMQLYQNGLDSIMESVFCMLGEWAMHMSLVVVVVTVLTLTSAPEFDPALQGDHMGPQSVSLLEIVRNVAVGMTAGVTAGLTSAGETAATAGEVATTTATSATEASLSAAQSIATAAAAAAAVAAYNAASGAQHESKHQPGQHAAIDEAEVVGDGGATSAVPTASEPQQEEGQQQEEAAIGVVGEADLEGI